LHENPAGGRCCESIGLIEEELQNIFLNPIDGEQELYCFEVTDVSSIWKFCDASHDLLWLFRNGIKEKIIAKVNDDNNNENPHFLIDAAVLISTDKEFTWE